MLAKTGEQTDLMKTGVNLPNPAAYMQFQGQCAAALMDAIKKQTLDGKDNKFVIQIQQKDFLTFEAWQTLAMLNGCSVIVTETNEIKDSNGVVIAYDSWASCIEKSTGLVVARANMECGMESFPTQGKTGRDRNKAAKSASQTWAGSKACRMAFSFVAVLAGYEPTPADEMQTTDDDETANSKRRPVANENDHEWLKMCPQHGKPWHQGANQREPAHKADDMPRGWCNQSEILNPLLATQLEEVTSDLGWDKTDITPWLKDHFGATWSALNPHKKLEAIAAIAKLNGTVVVDDETGEVLERILPGEQEDQIIHDQQTLEGMPEEGTAH